MRRTSFRTMKISVPKETHPGETRAPLMPDAAGKLVKLGAQVEVEAGLGVAAGFPDEALHQGRRDAVRRPQGARRLRRHRAAPAQTAGGGNRVAQAGRHPREPARSVQRKGTGPEIRRARRERHQHGIHPAHDPRAENGRAVVAGEPRRLRGGDSRGALFQQDFPHDDHGGGNDSAVEGFHHRRRRGRIAGDCHGETARCESHRLRHAARGRGTGEIARRTIPEN